MQTDALNTGYGASLKKARAEAGLTQQFVADKLRLQPRLVEALEQEDYTVLPAPIYVRGYIRAYAQLVGCNAERLVRQYNQVADEDPMLKQAVPVEAHKVHAKVNRRWLVPLLLAVGLLFAGLAAFKVFQSHIAPAAEQQQSDVGAEIVPQVAAPAAFPEAISAGELANTVVTGVTEATFDADAVIDNLSIVDTGGEATVVQQTGGVDSVAETDTAQDTFDITSMPDRQDIMPAAPYGDDRLTLTFDGLCWVEAVDANGFRLLFGLFGDDDKVLTVEGQAPFQLILGNAHLVRIAVNDKQFELKRYIRSNNTARLLLKGDATLY